MLSNNPYLNFMGNTEEAMRFYKSVLGGKLFISRYGDVPGGEKMSAKEQGLVIHASLTFGQDSLIMATDALESMGQKLIFGNNFFICQNMESEAEADKVFAAMSAGGKVIMPMNKTFWGAYFGMCSDKYGVQWMINHTIEG